VVVSSKDWGAIIFIICSCCFCLWDLSPILLHALCSMLYIVLCIWCHEINCSTTVLIFYIHYTIIIFYCLYIHLFRLYLYWALCCLCYSYNIQYVYSIICTTSHQLNVKLLEIRNIGCWLARLMRGVVCIHYVHREVLVVDRHLPMIVPLTRIGSRWSSCNHRCTTYVQHICYTCGSV
jgi:hypothetical protein